MPQVAGGKLGANTAQEVDQLRRLQAPFDVGLGEAKLLGPAVFLDDQNSAVSAGRFGRCAGLFISPRPVIAGVDVLAPVSGSAREGGDASFELATARGDAPCLLGALSLRVCADPVAAARMRAPMISATRPFGMPP